MLYEGGNLATHDSALKRARQSEKKRQRNTAAKSLLKTYTKKIIKAVERKDRQQALNALQAAIPKFQKVAAKGVIHKKTAARHISRLTKRVNALNAVTPPSPGASS